MKHALLGFLGALFIRLLHLTWRVDEQPKRQVARSRENRHGGGVWVMWHSRILMGAATQKGLGMRVMISMHGDGEIIAQATRHLGFLPMRGSSSRGGSRVLGEAVAEIAAGADVAITPDGPRGPRMSVHPGCVLAASRSGVPLIPVGFDAARGRRLRSWDRFLVPGLFTRVAVRFGEPLTIPPGLGREGVEEWCERVREALLEVTRQAAEAVGTSVESPDVDPLAIP